MAELLLELHALGDVLRHDDEVGLAGDGGGLGREENAAGSAGFLREGTFAAAQGLGLTQGGHESAVVQHGVAVRENFLAAESGEGGEGFVHVSDVAGGKIEDCLRHRRGFEGDGEALFTVAQLSGAAFDHALHFSHLLAGLAGPFPLPREGGHDLLYLSGIEGFFENEEIVRDSEAGAEVFP